MSLNKCCEIPSLVLQPLQRPHYSVSRLPSGRPWRYTKGVVADVTPSFGLVGRGSKLLVVGGLELKIVKRLDCSIDPVVETENLEDKFGGEGWRSSRSRVWIIRRCLVRKKTMTPRTNDSVPRNESTVIIAIKDPESCDDDTASLCAEGDDVGDDDACCELGFDCVLGADEVDVIVGDGSGVTGVTDTIIVDVGRPAGDVTVAWLGALCEVVVTNEGAGTTGDEERATTGGGREVITGGTGGRREVTMGGSTVVIGVSDDAGGITGGSPSVVAEIRGLVTTGVTDGRTTGEAVGGDMSDDADGVTGEGPAGIDKDEGQSLTTVVTDGRTPGAKDKPVTEIVSCDADRVDGDGPSSTGGEKDRAVTDDAGGIAEDVHAEMSDVAGPSVPPEKDTPVPNRDELEDTTGVQDEVVLGLVQGVLMLECNIDSDGLDVVAVASVLVNGIADIVSEAETILSSSPESLATLCKPLSFLKA